MKKLLPKYFFLFSVFMVTMAFFELIHEFLLSIFWALTLTTLFYRRFEKLRTKMPQKPDLAAGITVTYALMILIIPLVIVSVVIAMEAGNFATKIKSEDVSIEDKVKDLHGQIPIRKKTLKKYGLSMKKIKKKFNKAIEKSTQNIATWAIGFTQNILGLVTNFFLMLYVFYFFLRDGRKLIRLLIWVIPMKDEMEWELFRRFEGVARATIKGSLVVAMVQGLLGGILFFCLGIDSAFLWGTIMVITSLLPIGSALIWGPWSMFLIMQGDLTKGIIMIVVGVGFIGLVDNFLRPWLVGKDTKMPDYLILISTLGGLTCFGLSGFVIGPVIASLFITFWYMMGEEYGSPFNKVMANSKEI